MQGMMLNNLVSKAMFQFDGKETNFKVDVKIMLTEKPLPPKTHSQHREHNA